MSSSIHGSKDNSPSDTEIFRPPTPSRSPPSPFPQTLHPRISRESSYGFDRPSPSSFRSSSSQRSLADRFAELRDAIYFSTEPTGFILSADEKFAYPCVHVGTSTEAPAEIEDLETFFSGSNYWDEKGVRRLTFEELPAVWLSRNRKNFKGKRLVLMGADNRKLLLEAKGECIYAPGTSTFLGGVTWLNELGELEDVRRQEQQQALESFETICDSLPHMVWTADTTGQIDYYSTAWYAFTGWPEGDTKSHSWREVIHPEDESLAWETWERALASGIDQEAHFRLRRYDGLYRWMSGRARPKKDEQGKIVRMYGTTTDIHDFIVMREEAKRLEAEGARLAILEANARESSRVRGQFLAYMSHELRTPIAGIIGMARLIRNDTPLNVEQREYADCIRLSADNLLTIVNDLLDFSKIESGRFQIEKRPFKISALMDDLIRVWSHVAQQKGLQLKTCFQVAQDVEMLADPTRIRQILSNLLSNATKFTKSGSVTLLTRLLDGGSNLEIRVEDTGIGIEAPVMNALFTPFRQGDTSTARLYGGTGLLALLMDGTLHLESIPDTGTKAILVLPTQRLGHPKPQEIPNVSPTRFISGPRDSLPTSSSWSAVDTGLESKTMSPKMQWPNVQSVQKSRQTSPRTELIRSIDIRDVAILSAELRQAITVLVVEDNVINQRIAVKTIQNLGFRVQAASNGQEALGYLAARNKADIILLDCQMPVLDGYNTARRLRDEEPYISIEVAESDKLMEVPRKKAKRTLKDLPVIALTASAIPGDREKCYGAGMDDYLTKPMEVDALEKMLVKWLRCRFVVVERE